MAGQVESCHKLEEEQLGLEMGKREIIVQGVQDPQDPEMIFSLFQKNFAVEMISVQRMRRLSRKEPVYLVVISTTNDTANDSSIADSMKQSIVIVNYDKIPPI